MRWLTLILFMLNCACLQAQFTYFNQITGEQGDLESEVTANVEVVDEGYVIWSGGVNEDGPFYFVRKYDFEGTIINENVMIFPDEYFYTGIINSFRYNNYTNEFVVLQGSNVSNGIVEARMLLFNEELELIDDLYFDTYAPYTYFFGFLIEEDGYVIYGEYGSAMNVQATFIMKLDFEGNVVWTEILQEEVYQHIYRNWGIVKIDGGYLIAGGGRQVGEAFSLITETDEYGVSTSEEFIVDEEMLRTYQYKAVKELNTGEYLFGTTVAYADVEEMGNPDVFWTKIRLAKYDPETNEIYWQQDYHGDFELILGGVADIEPTSDGGAVVSGGRYGWFFDTYSWLMKIDAEGNEEWYREYTYETCDDCTNIFGDIESTPDGGYIMAGHFVNYAVDPRTSTWLVKVDACGDVEWQGCDVVGLQEQEAKQFKVYPNPSRGRFTVETESQTRVASWQLYDLLGRQVAQGSSSQDGGQFSLDVNLPSGLYTLHLHTESGKLQEMHKIQILK